MHSTYYTLLSFLPRRSKVQNDVTRKVRSTIYIGTYYHDGRASKKQPISIKQLPQYQCLRTLESNQIMEKKFVSQYSTNRKYKHSIGNQNGNRTCGMCSMKTIHLTTARARSTYLLTTKESRHKVFI